MEELDIPSDCILHIAGCLPFKGLNVQVLLIILDWGEQTSSHRDMSTSTLGSDVGGCQFCKILINISCAKFKWEIEFFEICIPLFDSEE